jgi:Immunoglobulin-like domain of bacterial spore germination
MELLVVTLGALTACTGGVDRLTGVLAATPTPTRAPSVSTSPSAPTPSPTGSPAIVVESPLPGDELRSPITVRGTADVFEASVGIRVLDASGQVLAAINTQASCGPGCRGAFSTPLAFFTPTRQPGTIEVFEASAKDGSAIDVVSIPITLVPGA